MPLELQEGLYVMPTPAGAYQAVCAPEPHPIGRFLRTILCCQDSPRLDLAQLQALSGLDTETLTQHILEAQEAGWLQGFPEASSAPSAPLEQLLPALLPVLSSSGKTLLADHQGFHVHSTGYPPDTAEELAALSASLGDLYERNLGLLRGDLHVLTSAWALVDSAGNSRVGFWPIFIGSYRFVLVVADMPRLNQPETLSLLWALTRRYGSGI